MRQWNLIRFRKEAGLTQEEFSELVKIKLSPYRLKESGKVDFKSTEMFRIARFFGKEIEDVFLDLNSTENGNYVEKSIENRISING